MGVAPVISYQYGAQKEKEVEKSNKDQQDFFDQYIHFDRDCVFLFA